METFPHKSLPPKSSSQGLLLGNPTKDRISFHLSLPGAPPSHPGSISSSLSPLVLPALPSAPGRLTQPPPPPPWKQMASPGQESSLHSDLWSLIGQLLFLAVSLHLLLSSRIEEVQPCFLGIRGGLCQWFSAGDNFVPRGTFGSVGRHFGLSQLASSG